MADSILDDIKQLLGIEASYTQFDVDIMIHINSVFSIVHQIGAGPQAQPFSIEDNTAVWSDFILDKPHINMFKSYMFAKVRLLFDAPQNSFGISALQEMTKEFESRLNYLEGMFVIPEPA